MAHKFRRGIPDMVQLPVALTGVVPTSNIALGDLVAVNATGYAIPITLFTWTTDTATTRAALVAGKFAGHSTGRSRAATVDERDLFIPVTQDGDYEADVDSATYVYGSLLAPKKGAGNNLTNTLEAVATLAQATHVALETKTDAVTKLMVRLINTAVKRAQ